MPDAYENYMTFERHMRKLQATSLMTSTDTNYFTYDYDSRTMSTAGSFSPSSMESPGSQQMDTGGSPSATGVFTDMIPNSLSNDGMDTFEKTEIKIVVQPVDKFRFRYKSEMMGTHGSLLGEREGSSHKKEVPTVKLINCPVKNAVIRCTLVTVDEDRRFPHAHHLVRKNEGGDQDDPHDIKVSDENDYTAMFCNMGIIHTAKKNIKDEILRKRKFEVLEEKKRLNRRNIHITTKEDLEMKMEAEKAQKWMNLNSVALCFQGFCYGENGVLHPLTEKIYSRPINNLKSALTGELKICRIDKHTSSCDGNEEVWLLVEKVGRKNIKVKLYEVDEDGDNSIWEAEGRFSELDVHHQYAIVFKTPPYKNTAITAPVEVFMRLERPSDGEVSNSIKFVYKPSEKNLNRKRLRSSSPSASTELAQSTTPAQQILNNCLSEALTRVPADEISNVSEEIIKLLNENENNCNSEEVREFIRNDSSFEQWLSIALRQTMNSELVADGLASSQLPRSENFAVDTLMKIMNILKEMESKSKSESLMTDMKDLLQETTSFSDTPLHFALRNEQFDIAKRILVCIATDPMFKNIVNLQNSSGKTPLHLAVLQNQPEIVRALLKLGADPNICDEDDATSLHTAVLAETNSCIDELLNSGNKLNLEAHTESGWSALHLAAKTGSLPAVKALLDAGANVNSTDMSYGRTALHIAVDSNHIHIVNYLLSKTKIDVNMKNFGGNTALHSAVVKGGRCAEELVKILKKHGADPNIRNNNANHYEEDEDNGSVTSPTRASIMDLSPTIKSENSDSDDDASRTGESSFDLAQDDPKLMRLLSQQRPQHLVEEELDLKEESEDEMSLMERSAMQQPSLKERKPPAPTVTTLTSKQQLQLQQLRQGDEKLSDQHVKRVTGILDRTGGWERLAQHTRNASLVRLHRKTSSPSSALFNKIRLQMPEITVSQLKKLLIEVQAYEAAKALDLK